MKAVQSPPQEQMMEFIMGKIISRAVSMAAELSISDHLANGPVESETLARKAGVKAGPLYRLLRTLSSVGIYRELPDKVFENNELSETLRRDDPASLGNFARWFGTDIHSQIYANMEFSLKTGKPAINKMHPDMDPFAALSQYEEDQEVFQQAMSDLTKLDGRVITETYDFSTFETIADVGGGFGTLLEFIHNETTDPKLYLLDLPHVIDKVGGKLPGNVKSFKGSFLDPIPFTADLIILKRIIHDWNDEEAIRILSNCKDAMNERGKILICDALITEGAEGIPAKLMDIEMLVGNGGRDRTRDEVQTICSEAGLRITEFIPTQSNIWIMECEKV